VEPPQLPYSNPSTRLLDGPFSVPLSVHALHLSSSLLSPQPVVQSLRGTPEEWSPTAVEDMLVQDPGGTGEACVALSFWLIKCEASSCRVAFLIAGVAVSAGSVRAGGQRRHQATALQLRGPGEPTLWAAAHSFGERTMYRDHV
jgi:hypothetical protein